LEKINRVALEKDMSDNKFWEGMIEYPKDGNVWWIRQGS